MPKRIDLDADGELQKLAQEFAKIGSEEGLREANDEAETKSHVEAAKAAGALPKPVVLGGIALVLLIIAVLAFLNLTSDGGGTMTTAPDVMGKDLGTANALIAAQNLRIVVTYDPATKSSPGKVIKQSPAAGKRVEERTDLQVTIAGPEPKGAAVTPGATPARPRPQQNFAPPAPAPTPAHNTSVPPTTTPPPAAEVNRVEVPDVADVLDSKAKSQLEALGLKVEFVPVANAGKPAHVVLGCDPRPGSLIVRGSTVRVSVSGGETAPAQRNTVAVGNYAGRTSQETMDDLRTRGLAPTWRMEVSRTITSGRVIRTEPPAGSQLPLGSAITVVIAK